jgi:hypothetical protein
MSGADCGHDCCEVRDNPYHSHVAPPERCLRCARVRAAQRRRETDAIVTAVLTDIAPEIDGLPEGDLLAGRVRSEVARAERDGRADPDLAATSPEEWLLVMAGRVGLALAFPRRADTGPPRRSAINGWDDRRST